jgi:hypothetical protein
LASAGFSFSGPDPKVNSHTLPQLAVNDAVTIGAQALQLVECGFVAF